MAKPWPQPGATAECKRLLALNKEAPVEVGLDEGKSRRGSTINTVTSHARHTASATAHDMRVLMRDQGITASALAWILQSSPWRAFALRYYSTNWMVSEVVAVVCAAAPVSKSVPIYGVFADVHF